MEEKLKELEKRIADLEKRPVYVPYYPQQQFPPNPNITPYPQQLPPTGPPPHYHNGNGGAGIPCYNNPCTWC